MPIYIIILTFLSTYLGGLFALRFKDKLHLILGFSAGAVIGVTFFDLIPEAISIGGEYYGVETITSIIAIGFVGYLLLDRFTQTRISGINPKDALISSRGTLGALSLSLHSFLDGVAIGLAFQISSGLGAIVAIAVLVHDFSDGINTVNIIFKNGGTRNQALQWLFCDALAPILGLLSTLFFTLPAYTLGIVLALFSGFFLYIGASDLLPESHHNHPTTWTTVMTVVGISVLYFAIRFANP